MSVVLLIDDEPQMASLVGMVLDGKDVEVLGAANQAEAVEMGRRAAPDVILLDIALGEEDGLAILPRLREEPALSSVPVIAFSVHDSRQGEALERGAAGFVKKPFTSAALLKALDPYLEPR